jgi:hypothetical protein
MATSSRLALAAGAAGLAGGLALGITGFASAADPTPSPRAGSERGPDERGFGEHRFGHRGPGHGPGPGMRMGRHHGAGGLVQSVGSSSLSVLTREGARTIALNGDTGYYVGRTKATKAAVQQGLVVAIRLVDPRADKPVAAVVTVVPAHVAGWVTDVDGDTVTVTDLSGFTRTIRLDSSTTYVKDGATASRSVVVKGALVRAAGEVADDGTTLEADRVAVGRPGQKGEGDEAPGPAGEPNA